MKYLILFILTASFFDSVGQTTTEEALKKIETIDEAKNFLERVGSKQGELLFLNSSKDTSAFYKKLYIAAKGEIIASKNFLYKIIEKKTQASYRVTYIYLDASKLSLIQIDSIRNLILDRNKSGVAFAKLAKEFNMDGNPRNGDTDYFNEGTMVKEFEDAIRSHKTGEVFKVDIPSNSWYYVVKKTFPDKNTTKVTVVKARKSS